MNTFLTLLAIAVSVAALLRLSFTDPKRRRAFGQAPYPGPRRPRLAWIVALLPGGLVIPLAGGPGFVLWLGALTVVGWALIAIPPSWGEAFAAGLERWFGGIAGRAARLGRRAREGLARLGARLPAAPVLRGADAVAGRVAELERKVALLETELARLRGEHTAETEDRRGVRVA